MESKRSKGMLRMGLFLLIFSFLAGLAFQPAYALRCFGRFSQRRAERIERRAERIERRAERRAERGGLFRGFRCRRPSVPSGVTRQAARGIGHVDDRKGMFEMDTTPSAKPVAQGGARGVVTPKQQLVTEVTTEPSATEPIVDPTKKGIFMGKPDPSAPPTYVASPIRGTIDEVLKKLKELRELEVERRVKEDAKKKAAAEKADTSATGQAAAATPGVEIIPFFDSEEISLIENHLPKMQEIIVEGGGNRFVFKRNPKTGAWEQGEGSHIKKMMGWRGYTFTFVEKGMELPQRSNKLIPGRQLKKWLGIKE